MRILILTVLILSLGCSSILCPDVCAPSGSSVTVLGDSFCDSSGEFQDQILDYVVSSDCSPGRPLSIVESLFSASAQNAYNNGHKYMIIEGGINDICGGNKSSTYLLSLVSSIILEARQIGIGVIFVEVAPMKNHTCWTEAKQSVINEYNSTLQIYANQYAGVRVARTNKLLDTDGDFELDLIFDNGDGLHPNAAGSAVIGGKINDVLLSTCNNI